MMQDHSRNKRFPVKKIIVIALCAVVLLIGAFITLRCNVESTFSSNECIADIDSLVVYIERVHPDPYRLLDKAEFYQAVAQSKSRLRQKKEITLIEFYDEVSRLTAMFNEGHLNVPIPEQIGNSSLKLFPYFTLFHLEPGTHRLLLMNDCEIEGEQFKTGDELMSINGKACREIVDSMLQHVSAESDGFRCARVDERDNMLDRLNCWLAVNMPADVYRTQIKSENGIKSVDIKSIGYAKWLFSFMKQMKDNNEGGAQPFSSELVNDSTLLFHFNECVTDGLKEFLGDMFAKAKADGVRYLIIDNRYNTGGSTEAGDELCRYLTDQPFICVNKVVVRFSEPIRTLEREYLDGVMPPRDTIVTKTFDPATWNQPYGPKKGFNGDVYLLNSHLTFSSAVDFASQFAYFKMGTIIGEETGGMTVSSGDIISMRLPNTGISVVLPFKLFCNIGADENAPVEGVKPDIEVVSSGALDKALDLIQKGK